VDRFKNILGVLSDIYRSGYVEITKSVLKQIKISKDLTPVRKGDYDEIYHFTTLLNIPAILDSNALKPFMHPYVSFSTDPKMGEGKKQGWSEVRMILDSDKLLHDFPLEHFVYLDSEFYKFEKEVRTIREKEWIESLNKYVKEVDLKDDEPSYWNDEMAGWNGRLIKDVSYQGMKFKEYLDYIKDIGKDTGFKVKILKNF